MFSVIIPLYNKSETIERAIRSVLDQTFPQFELIVVDDGSTDRGVEIVRSISDPRIRLIRQENGGVSKARNTGIEAAEYDYVTFLDADDEYLPEFLETMRNLIEKYPDAGIYGTSYWLLDPDGSRKEPVIRGIPAGYEGVVKNYFEVASVSAPIFCSDTVCIRKQAVMEIGKFPLGIRSGEDLLTWARLCAKYPLAYSCRPLSVYHLGDAGYYQPKRIPPENDIVGKCLVDLFKKTQIQDLKAYIAFWHKNRISSFIRLNKKKAALKECLTALAYSPFNAKIYSYIILIFLPQTFVRWVLTAFRK